VTPAYRLRWRLAQLTERRARIERRINEIDQKVREMSPQADAEVLRMSPHGYRPDAPRHKESDA
jgi:hypothetical protein